MTPFSHCKKAEILYPAGEPPIQASVSMGASSGLMVVVPREIKCPLRTPIDIRFFDPIQGIVRCRCRLTHPAITGNVCVYRCKVLENLYQLQRREDIKVPQSLSVTVDCEGVLFPATILNLSAGGVYLISGLTATVGDQFSFTLPKTTPALLLKAEVLRAELQVMQGRSVHGYGCRFVDLNVGQENLLRRYVFQEERKIYMAEE